MIHLQSQPLTGQPFVTHIIFTGDHRITILGIPEVERHGISGDCHARAVGIERIGSGLTYAQAIHCLEVILEETWRRHVEELETSELVSFFSHEYPLDRSDLDPSELARLIFDLTTIPTAFHVSLPSIPATCG